MSRKKEKTVTKTWSPMPEDLELLEDLKLQLSNTMGAVSDTAILRMGLRALAQQKENAA